MDESRISDICRALGDTNRLKIIRLLATGELCACRLLEEFQITQPTLSHHMKTLSSAGLVSVRKEGKWSYYSINCAMFREFKAYFESVTCSKDAARDSCCCGGGC